MLSRTVFARLAGALLIAASAVSAQARPTARPTANTDFGARFRALAAQPGLSDSVRLHRLFKLDWDYINIEFPENATYSGYPGQNDRWTDLSVAAFQKRRRILDDRARAIRAVNRARLRPADQLSYDIYKRDIDEEIEGSRFPGDLMQITQRRGPQYLSDDISTMPAATVKDYEDILARLQKVPTVVEQTIVLLDSGLTLGVTPPRVTLRDVPQQVLGLIPEDASRSPLLAKFSKFPPDIAPADRQRLTAEATKTFNERVRPSYARLHEYLTKTYLPRSRETIAAKDLPNGEAWYAFRVRQQTTTTRTPKEIHELGLSEVARIRGRMDSIIKVTGFTGDFAAFTKMLRTDPRFYHKDSASLVRAYRDIAKRIDPELPKLFGKLPRLPYGVTTIPSYSAPSQTTAYYQQGSPDAHRAGQYYVNTYLLDTRPIWEMEALSIHEAVPGHHLQIALSQEMENVPEFRRYGGYTAFVEGWALYSESLGPALGMYQDPYSQFGQLTYEIWRAIRLVIDPGIHMYGWSRQQAIDYFVANSAKTLNDITNEVDRYIVWPAQALAYKSGELAIKSLRAHAEKELGEKFDIRAFHDELLGQGALPLDVLEPRMRRWVAAQKLRM